MFISCIPVFWTVSQSQRNKRLGWSTMGEESGASFRTALELPTFPSKVAEVGATFRSALELSLVEADAIRENGDRKAEEARQTKELHEPKRLPGAPVVLVLLLVLVLKRHFPLGPCCCCRCFPLGLVGFRLALF